MKSFRATQWRLASYWFLLLIALILLEYGYFSYYHLKSYQNTLASQCTFIANDIRDFFISPKKNRDLTKKYAYLTGARVCVFDDRGVLLDDINEKKLKDYINSNIIDNVLSGKKVISGIYYSKSEKAHKVYSVAPVMSDNNLLGVVSLSIYVPELFKGKLVIIIILVASGGLYCFYLITTICEPVKRMNKMVQAMIYGDLDVSVKVNSNSEVGNLAASLNELAVSLTNNMQEIEKAEKRRKDFVANASHELRTPITSIMALSETLLSKGKGDTKVQDRFIRDIYKESRRLSNLVKDLLDLGKLEAGQFSKKESISLREIVLEAIGKMKLRAERQQVALKYKVPDEISLLKANREHLMQMLLNLLDNAIKFTPKNGRVTVSLKEDPRNFQIIVSDTGIGIPESDVSQIFERFYRVDKTRARALGGTGLGLSIVKSIVDEHKGIIEVKSVLGKGSVFYITLPKGGLKKDVE